MMEKNSDIFLAEGDALVYLARPMYKKYPTIFVWAIHLVRTYFMTDFSTPPLPPPLPCTHIYAFRVAPLLRM